MALITCSLDNSLVKNYNKDTQKLLLGIRALVMNAFEQHMKEKRYPEAMLGRSGVKLLDSSEYNNISNELTAGFAKCALKYASDAVKEIHGTDDIALLANPGVYNDPGVQSFVNNALAAVLTPVFPAVASNAFDMLVDVRTSAVGESVEFDIVSNEVYKWSAGARGMTSYAHDRREMDTIVLNPRPVGTTFDIPWIRVARGEYDVGRELLAAVLGWSSYMMGLFTREISAAATALVGYDRYAPSFTTDNFVRVRSSVAIANGNLGIVYALGKETSLMRVLPDIGGAYTAELVSAVGDDYVRFGYVPVFARTPLIELADAFVPGTYADPVPIRVLPDGLFLFSSRGDKPILAAISGGMVQITRAGDVLKADRVTSHTMITEIDMRVNPAPYWGFIDVV